MATENQELIAKELTLAVLPHIAWSKFHDGLQAAEHVGEIYRMILNKLVTTYQSEITT